VVFVLLLFPTGSLPSRRWRPVAWTAAAAMGGWVLGNTFAPAPVDGSLPHSPVAIGGPAGHAIQTLGGVSGLTIGAAGIAAIVSLAFRYRRARTVEREQLKWLVYAGGIIVVALIAEAPIEQALGPGNAASNLQDITVSGAIALVPIAIGIAIFRYHLYDIDVVINKTLVYGSLAVFITGVYVAIVVGLGSLAQRGARPSLALSIAATAVVAVAFQPVRERVQRLANRLVYGRRATPYEVLADFAGRMAGAYAAEDLLPRMARILAEGTAATRADVWLKSGEVFHDGAAWPAGAPPLPPARATAADVPAYPAADRILPVRHQGEVLGALSVSKRPGEALTPTEDRLLTDLASQVGLVLKNAGLREQLLARLEEIRASRLRLVAAQDAERRRIERNIHDGAQQQLVALAIKLSITESMIGTDTEGERELLAELREDAAGAVEELRDLARGIYPPLLAGEGLVTALQAQARKAAVPTSVTADGVGRYQQDLEAAVYFCVLEALQNVAKYAGATRAEVRLAASGHHLRFEVTDDGAGFDPESRGYGTGLQGMADRLHAHGGSLDVRSAPGAGTTIAGRLPCRVLEAA
jgi:signal transduction histidine kinase